MKHLAVCLLAIFGFLVGGTPTAEAQLLERAGNLIRTAFRDADTVSVIAADSRQERDSLRIIEMERQLEQMRLNEMMLRAELDSSRVMNIAADSMRRERMRHHIDSLRTLTPGVPVVADGDTLFSLYVNRGGYTPRDRAEMVAEALDKIKSTRSSEADSVYTLDHDGYTYLMYGERVVVTLTDYDALWQGVSRAELAQRYKPLLEAKIADMKKVHSFKGIALRAVLFLLVLFVQYLLFKFTNYLFRKLRRYIIRLKQQRLKPVIVRDYELINKRQLGRIMIFFSNILRYIVLLIQLTFTVPVLFAIFPQTEKLALTIFSYIIEPVKMVLRAIGDYIPNLFIILVIWFGIRYLIKGLRYIAGEIENGKLKINGFYPDWARPTFNIVRFLLYAFMIAMIYPYLPGSDSGVFQGISVFVGLIVSLGSSTVIGNIIAGLVITYMRPFKIGDRIKLNETTGNVIEKTPFVTRLRTPKNEVVTIPNSFILSSHTVNFSASARQFGLIIHTTVTIGYDVPWRQVHQLLINAARLTPGVEESPKPFVLETELQDYYPCYQINAYIKDADRQAQIMTDLLQNIQDTFNEAGVEIMSPKYVATRDGNASTIPSDPLAP